MERDEEGFEQVVRGGAEQAAGHHPQHLVGGHLSSLISHLSEENEKENEGKFDNSKQLSRGS